MDKQHLPLRSQIAYLLQHVSSTLHRQVDEELQKRLGIGMSQYKILMVLQWSPNVQQRQLAASLGQTEASISRQIKVLHDKGLLVTRIDPNERRIHHTLPTDRGMQMAAAAGEVLNDYSRPMFDRFSDTQLQQLQTMLTQMHAVTCDPLKPHACNHPLGS